MNGDEAKKIVNRHTVVSIGLVISMLSAVIGGTMFLTKVRADVDSIKDDYIPRGELNQRLINIESGVKDIKDYLLK